MRILHLDPDDIDNPMSGGGPIRTHEIYRRLAARHEITVLTPTFAGSTPEVVRDGVRFVRLGRKVGDHGSSHHITFFFALPGAVRRGQYDLLVEDFMPPTGATLNPLFARAPVIGSVQWLYARTLARQYRLPFHVGERYGVRLYRHMVTLSEAMRRQLLAWHPGARCEVIPSGVDAPLFDLPIRPGRFVLFMGRVDFEQKGVDLLLEAYARVPAEERLPLVLAGHSFQQERVTALVGALGLAPWVQLVGKVDAARRAELLRDCRFFVMPSREETFGMVIPEACASGTPIVLFDQPPMRDIAAPGACAFVPPFDVDAYVAALRGFLRADDAELARRGAACRAWARQFSWDEIARRQEAYYLEVRERHRARRTA